MAIHISDPARRAIRGFAQLGVVELFIGVYQAFAWPQLTPQQVTALTLAATPLVSLVHNLLEDNTQFPAFLKAPASGGKNPQPDGEPDAEP